MAMTDFHSNFIFFLRWIHIFAGITWIGHLYFFNFVNVPFQGSLEKDLKPRVNPLLLGRALWWFRWAAMITFLIGWLLFFTKYMGSDILMDPSTGNMSERAIWILLGAVLGTIMWFNVWFIIWPLQKKLLTWMKEGQSPPEVATLAKRALLVSRTNTYLSAPMLFAMIAPNNYPSFSCVTLFVVTAFGMGVVWCLIKISGKVGQI